MPDKDQVRHAKYMEPQSVVPTRWRGYRPVLVFVMVLHKALTFS